MNEIIDPVFIGSDHDIVVRCRMIHYDRNHGQEDVALDRSKQLDFFEEIGFAADYDQVDRIALADGDQIFKGIEMMEGNFIVAIELFEMKVEIDAILLDGKMKAGLNRFVAVYRTGPAREDGIFCVRQQCNLGQSWYISV